ncbi:inositol monophosphatase family protein [Undibacterium sp. TC9W]|uniref:inositol monophosphatase family protein n=1 Tax=Undibacterium sp. TC9W TaxID=3413053 RepID=UPI003BF190AF
MKTLNKTEFKNGYDPQLLDKTVIAVREAADLLLQRFKPDARPADLPQLLTMIEDNDTAVTAQLRESLLALRPGAQWLDDEKSSGALPAGEWWVADPAEGNVNHIHGATEWAVTATLVRDNVPVLTVVAEPLAAKLYTAVRGGGAYLNGQPLHVSQKPSLAAALVSTGQATSGEGKLAYSKIGQSVTAMLEHALLVRMAVPATMQLVQVASGQLDAFWQHGNVLAGVVSGALLVTEAGGKLTDWTGQPWTLSSPNFIASAPAMNGQLIAVLKNI